MTDPERIVEELRRIPRTDGGPDVVAEEEWRPDGTIVLRHRWGDHVLETYIGPATVGAEITVFLDGKLQLDAGPAERLDE